MVDEQFLVHPDMVRGYAGLLERNNGYVGEMRTHLDGPGSETKGLMGLMFQFQQIVENLNAGQRETLNTIQQKLAATAQGVRATADEYARTDAKSAAEMDKIVPKAPDTDPGAGRGAH